MHHTESPRVSQLLDALKESKSRAAEEFIQGEFEKEAKFDRRKETAFIVLEVLIVLAGLALVTVLLFTGINLLKENPLSGSILLSADVLAFAGALFGRTYWGARTTAPAKTSE